MLASVAIKLSAEDRSRVRASKAGYRKAIQVAARQRREALAAEARVRKAAEKLAAKEAARQAKIDEAAEGYCELPAVVLRDGTVKHIDYPTAIEIITHYLPALGVDVEHSGHDV